jgi:hypothetical protein
MSIYLDPLPSSPIVFGCLEVRELAYAYLDTDIIGDPIVTYKSTPNIPCQMSQFHL